ncbi:hypothetical protein TNIN_311291 [Trichonephila inaurata madagascariensis]|uniref:Uncharacterized protein n=1 Tax=Trichonephila inaurata madagascariensis TaxID=2747483 RepID=A0A8X6YSA4_9ARAC|nr:hypothetical protein TNIN_311291 [Trichonephila inaurata madagascariensis]
MLRGTSVIISTDSSISHRKDQRRSRRLTSEPVSGAKLGFIVEVCPGGSEDELILEGCFVLQYQLHRYIWKRIVGKKRYSKMDIPEMARSGRSNNGRTNWMCVGSERMDISGFQFHAFCSVEY